MQTPERQVSTVNDLQNTPVAAAPATRHRPFRIARQRRNHDWRYIQSVINHNNVAPVYDIYASVSDRDLGGVAGDIDKMSPKGRKLKPGNTITLLGQAESMNSAFGRFGIGLPFAAVFVYLLMVVNFQDFIDPLAVILGLPGAGCGIVMMLFITGTTFSVPSLMGAIMAIGVASANSILLVTFARERLLQNVPPREAAMRSGQNAAPPGIHDRGRHGRGHASHGYWRPWRGAEFRAGARRDRRSSRGDADNPLRGSLYVRHDPRFETAGSREATGKKTAGSPCGDRGGSTESRYA